VAPFARNRPAGFKLRGEAPLRQRASVSGYCALIMPLTSHAILIRSPFDKSLEITFGKVRFGAHQLL